MSATSLRRNQEHWFRSPWVWLGAMGVVAVAAAPVLHAPVLVLASWLVIGTVGWILHRFGRATVIGIVLWAAAGVLMSASLWASPSLGDPWVRILHFLPAAGLALTLPAGLVFLVASVRDRKRCAGNCAGCMVVLFSIIVPAVSACTIHRHRARCEAVQETRQLILMLHQVAGEIEAIRAQTGQLPKDEAELVALRGKPLPAYYREYRTKYYRTDSEGAPGRDGYYLDCTARDFWGEHQDLFGWILFFHGPHAVQRLDVDLF